MYNIKKRVNAVLILIILAFTLSAVSVYVFATHTNQHTGYIITNGFRSSSYYRPTQVEPPSRMPPLSPEIPPPQIPPSEQPRPPRLPTIIVTRPTEEIPPQVPPAPCTLSSINFDKKFAMLDETVQIIVSGENCNNGEVVNVELYELDKANRDDFIGYYDLALYGNNAHTDLLLTSFSPNIERLFEGGQEEIVARAYYKDQVVESDVLIVLYSTAEEAPAPPQLPPQFIGGAVGLNEVFVKEENGIARINEIARIPLGFGPNEIPASQINSMRMVPNFRIGNIPTQLHVTSFWKGTGNARTGAASVLVTLAPGEVKTYPIYLNNPTSQPPFTMHPSVQNALNSGQIKFIVEDIVTPVNGWYEGIVPPLYQMELIRDGPVERIYRAHIKNLPVVTSVQLCPQTPGDPKCSFFEEDVYLTITSGKPYIGVQSIIANWRKLDDQTWTWIPPGPSSPGHFDYSIGQLGKIFYKYIKMSVNTGSQNVNAYFPHIQYLIPSSMNQLSPTQIEFFIMPQNAQQILMVPPYNEFPNIPNAANHIDSRQRFYGGDIILSFDSSTNNYDPLFYNHLINGGTSLQRWNLVHPEVPDPNSIRPNTNFVADAQNFFNYWFGQVTGPTWGHRWGTYMVGHTKLGTCAGCKDVGHFWPTNFWRYMFSCGSGYCQDEYIKIDKFMAYGLVQTATYLKGYNPLDHFPNTVFPLNCITTSWPDQLGECNFDIQTPNAFRIDTQGRDIDTYYCNSEGCGHGWATPDPAFQIMSDVPFFYMFTGDPLFYDLADDNGKWISTIMAKDEAIYGLYTRYQGKGLLTTVNAYLINPNNWYKKVLDHLILLLRNNIDTNTVSPFGNHPLTGDPLPVGYFKSLTYAGQGGASVGCATGLPPSPPEQIFGSDCVVAQGWQLYIDLAQGVAQAYEHALTNTTSIQSAETMMDLNLNFMMNFMYKHYDEVKNAVSAYSSFWASIPMSNFMFWCPGSPNYSPSLPFTPSWCNNPPPNWAYIPITQGHGGFTAIRLVIVSPCGTPQNPTGCQGNPPTTCCIWNNLQAQPWINNSLGTIPLTTHTQHMTYKQDVTLDNLGGACSMVMYYDNLDPAKKAAYLAKQRTLYNTIIKPGTGRGFFYNLMQSTGTSLADVDLWCAPKLLSQLPNALEQACPDNDADNDGATSCAGDCQPNNPAVGIHVADENCFDGIDNNCNQLIDCNDLDCFGIAQCKHTSQGGSSATGYCGDGIVVPGAANSLGQPEECDFRLTQTPSQVFASYGVNNCPQGRCIPGGLPDVPQGCRCAQTGLWLSTISPNSVPLGSPVLLSLSGSGFQNGAVAIISPNPTPFSTTFNSVNSLTLSLTSSQVNSLSVGTHNVIVQNPGGQQSNMQVLTINPASPSCNFNNICQPPETPASCPQDCAPPQLNSLSPNAIFNNIDNNVQLSGSNFIQGATVHINGDPQPWPSGWITYNSQNSITMYIPAYSPIGTYSITVKNPSGLQSNAQTLIVNPGTGGTCNNNNVCQPAIGENPSNCPQDCAAPNLVSLSPPSIINNIGNWVDLNGNNFVNGATIHVDGSANAYPSAWVNYINQNNLEMWVPQGTPAGSYAITVKNPSGLISSAQTLVVNLPGGTCNYNNICQPPETPASCPQDCAPPVLASLNPNIVTYNVAQVVSLDATNTVCGGCNPGSTSTIIVNGAQYPCFWTSFGSCPDIDMYIPPSTPAGNYQIKIRNPSGLESSALRLTISAPPPYLNELVNSTINHFINNWVVLFGSNFAASPAGPILANPTTTSIVRINNQVPYPFVYTLVIDPFAIAIYVPAFTPMGVYLLSVRNPDGSLSNQLPLTII